RILTFKQVHNGVKLKDKFKITTFKIKIWSLIYLLKKNTFICPQRDIESLQKNTT
mgnify:CR=1